MGRKKWVGDRGEEIQHDRLAIWRAGATGKVYDRTKDNVGYDYEVQRYNIYTHQWETERHEVKTKSRRSRGFPGLTRNEREARIECRDEYYVDEVELPSYLENYYDEFLDTE